MQIASAFGTKVTPQASDPAVQQSHNEQVEQTLIACYSNGLAGNTGLQVQFRCPDTMDEAV
jgi:hypothetical protein